MYVSFIFVTGHQEVYLVRKRGIIQTIAMKEKKCA